MLSDGMQGVKLGCAVPDYSESVRAINAHSHRHTVTPYHDTGRVSIGVGDVHPMNSEHSPRLLYFAGEG